jgi:P pilus assembly chaperone PapD
MNIYLPHKLGRIAFFVLFWTFLASIQLFASISATPKFLFLDATRRSTPIQISNLESDEREVFIEVKFGYVTSDDSGRAIIFLDTVTVDPYSAAPWIQVYPKRFVFGPGETQTVRLTTTPPPNLKDGEYWARILITSKPRKPTATAKPREKTGGGLVLTTQIGLPFHYRYGKVATGLEINNLDAHNEGSDLNISFKLKRTGNASYWGTRTIKITDPAGKSLYSVAKNAVVYNSFNVVEHLSLQNLPAGTYHVEVELATGKRSDIRKDDLISAPLVRSSIPFVVR